MKNEHLLITNNTNPCVRNCCLNEKDICLGCFRTLEEITGWQRFTKKEKVVILEMCTNRRNDSLNNA